MTTPKNIILPKKLERIDDTILLESHYMSECANTDLEALFFDSDLISTKQATDILIHTNSIILWPIKIKSKDSIEESEQKACLFFATHDNIMNFLAECVINKQNEYIDIINFARETIEENFIDVQNVSSSTFSYKVPYYNELKTLQEKINFLYVLANSLSHFSKSTDYHKKTIQITRQYLFSIVKTISQEQNPDIQNSIFTDVVQRLIFNIRHLIALLNQVFSLGYTQKGKTYKNNVLLNNGILTDLFTLSHDVKASILHDISIDNIKIDLDLSNLDIQGNFSCQRVNTQIKFPKSINGVLDCSYCSTDILNFNSGIPQGTTVLNIAHTVKSWDQLNRLQIPNTLNTIIISEDVLNLLKNDPNAVDIAKQFISMHTNIRIKTGTKDLKTQLDILGKKEEFNNTTLEQHTIKSSKHKKEDSLTRNELLNALKQNEQIQTLNLDDEMLKRLLIRAIKLLKIHEEPTIVANGITMLCISKKHVDTIEKKS